MELLATYGEDGAAPSLSEDEHEDFRPTSTALVSAAPQVDTTGLALLDNMAVAQAATQHLPDARARKMLANLPYEQMHAAVVGPAHPYQKDGIAAGMRNHRAGHVEDHHMHHFTFDDQYHTYHSFGYAQAPEGHGAVGDAETFQQQQGASIYNMETKRKKTEAEKAEEAARKRQRAEANVAVAGEAWEMPQRQPWSNKAVAPAKPTVEELEWLEQEGFIKDEEEEEGKEGGRSRRRKAAAAAIPEKTMFHGKVEPGGRSWMEPPKERRPEVDFAFLPKRWIHTWSGHTKGVNAIRFFPKTGHLLLSAGLDGKIKIWDVYNTQKCMRTYLGFSKGVKDIQFSNDGRRFLSSSYDKVIKLWDTETGQVIRSFGEGKMFFVAKFHPNDDKQNVMMAGCQDKKVYQWDMDTGDIVQEYEYHLGAVNTITFVDEGRRFVTTSDDKTIRAWEFGIPVQIKYIADPGMHSIPAIAVHPNKKWFIGQSLDNQIVTYSALDKFRQNRKKTFKGHTAAGYACQPNFSPDGRYVISGDGEGKLWFWDWKTCKAYRTIKAHSSVCINAEWHPLETSKVATCGWDGAIKYWD